MLLVPLVVSAVTLMVAVGDDYLPASDFALMELKTRDVGRHAVLTGLYSRDGWSHPGPSQFYLLAVPYRLVGSRAIGLPLGALMLNGLAIAGMALIARRRGGLPLLLFTVVGCGLLIRSLGADFVRSPWNLYLPVLPFGLLIFLTWEMTCGTTWALPVAAGVASFCMQTHIGYVPMAIPLLVWGGAWLLVLARRRPRADSTPRHPDGRGVVRAAALAIVVVAVMWLPPLLEQLTHSPGNLSRTTDWFRDARDGTHTLSEGYRVVGGQYGLPPNWLTGERKLSGLTGEPEVLVSAPLPVLLVPFALSAVVLWRRRNSEGCRLIATLWLTLLLGVVSVMRTVGIVYEGRLLWTWLLAMLTGVVTAWAGWMLVPTRWPRSAMRALVAVALATMLVLGVVNTVGAARAGTPQKQWTPHLAAIVPSLLRALPEGDGDVVFAATTSPESDYYEQGLILELERRGVAARVLEDPAARFGNHRVHQAHRPIRAVLTVADSVALHNLSRRPRARLVAYSGIPRRVLARAVMRLAELELAYKEGKLTFEEFARRGLELPLTPAIGVLMETSAVDPGSVDAGVSPTPRPG